MTLSERMVEAAARASHNANLGGFRPWDVLAQASAEGSTFAAVVMERQRNAARAALTAALAVAEAEGAGVFVVPEERRFLSGEGEHVDSANAGAAGHNDCRAATLAGRVTL